MSRLLIDDAVLSEKPPMAGRQVELPVPGGTAAPDAVAHLAARALAAPMGIVTVVRGTDIHCIGLFGGPRTLAAARDLPLTGSLCPVVLSSNRPLVVGELATHPRYAGFAAVTRDQQRAYLGVPLRDRHGRALGVVAAVDSRARRWTAGDLTALQQLAELLGPPPEHGSSDGPTALVPPPGAGPVFARRSEFLNAVFDSLRTGVAVCDTDGRVVLINRAMRQVYGLPDGGGAAVPVTGGDSLSRPDGGPLRLRDTPLIQALDGEPVRDAEVIINTAGASPHVFAVNAEPIRDSGGSVVGAVMAAHDITMQRRADRFRACELQVSAALNGVDSVAAAGPRIAQVVAHTLRWPHVELWLLDPVTGVLRAAGHWTSPDVRIGHGGDGPIVKGLGITGAVWESGRPLWIPDIAVVDAVPAAASAVLAEACTAAGLHTAVAVPIDAGSMVGVLTCFADNREYDEAEIVSGLCAVAAHIGTFLSRRHVEGLTRQLDRTRDDFIALVGHELRTPLTSIVSYVQFLLDGDDLDPDTAELLGAVARNTASLTAIVDDLLDFAAMHSGHTVMHPRPTDVSALVRESLADVEAAARANHVVLAVDVPAELVIDADPGRLRQVIGNLLSNAVKYSPDGGTATVRLSAGGGTAVLSIGDTGIGIPAEERTHMFRTFFRATNARHTAIAGTGLGLVIARAIVEAHGGVIGAVHDDPGTTITVRLPVSSGAGNDRAAGEVSLVVSP